MVRTKADSTGVKVSGAKAPRKALPVTPSRTVGGDSDKSKSQGGGNSYYPRETPGWQKPITNFFICPRGSSTTGSENSEGSCSSMEPKPSDNSPSSSPEAGK